MPTIREGAMGSAGSLAVSSSLRVVDMRDKIFHLEPEATPLTLLLNKVSKESCSNAKFDWTEDEPMPISDTVNGTFTTTTLTTFAVDNGEYFHLNDIIKNTATGEVMIVNSEPTSDTLDVTRNEFGTAPDAINDGVTLIRMGSAFPENSAAPTALEVVTANAYNYTQIFKDTFGVSGTADASKFYGGNKLAYLQKVRGIDHAKGIELAMFFGERSEDEILSSVAATYGHRTTGGLYQIISTNDTDMTVATANEIDAASAGDFRYGNQQSKVLFVSRTGASKLTQLNTGIVRLAPGAKTFGLNITQWITSGGIYNIIAHPLFVGEYSNIAIVADMDQLSYRYLPGRDTKLKTNVQSPGVDGRVDEYLSEVGLERRLEKTHAKWDNVHTA